MPAAPFDGHQIKLVVFDVDGTLYSQQTLRLRLAPELAGQLLSRRGRKSLKIVANYRRLREQFAEREVENFETTLRAGTCAATQCSAEDVQQIIGEWIHRRPLRHLKTCVFSGIPELFVALRSAGKTVAIYSDYAAQEKLAAMGLSADHIVSAHDPDIAMLKPNPKGLLQLMARAGVQPHETLLIGDRAERDGEAARRAGAHALIRSQSRIEGFQTFRDYKDPIFASLI